VTIEQKLRDNLKAASDELIVPAPRTSVDTPAPPGRRSGVWFAVAGVAAVLLLAVPAVFMWALPEPQDTGSPSTPTVVSSTAVEPTSPPTTDAPVGTTVTIGEPPGSAEETSNLFVDAWVSGDDEALGALATSEVLQSIGDFPAPVDPVFSFCEGAAGSLYCTYEVEEGELVIRVANQPPFQVTEVRPAN
jgi:hypothetical protein